MKAIDLFAGAGGFTEGAEKAGLQVVWAANHWPAAVDTHSANHPNTAHKCQDLHQADWSQIPDNDFFLASPCCQGHSHAKGKERPAHDASRSTAWAVVSAAEYHNQDAGIVENIPEFLNWKLYPAWKSAMEALGYSLANFIIDSADHGIPQHRKRLFIVCTKSKNPIELILPKRDHVAVNDAIEWDRYNWTPIYKDGRSEKTIARYLRGKEDLKTDRFVMPFYGSGSGLTGRSVERPLGTVTTRDRWAIVQGDKMRMFQPSEYKKIMGFPEHYAIPEKPRSLAIHLLGNAVCPPVATDLINAIKKAA